MNKLIIYQMKIKAKSKIVKFIITIIGKLLYKYDKRIFD